MIRMAYIYTTLRDVTLPGSRWNTTSYTVRGLVNQTGYTFDVRAPRGRTEGPASSDTATPEGPPSVPLTPQGLTVHPADRSLGLSWDPPVSEDSPGAGHWIPRALPGGGEVVAHGVAI